MILIYDLFFIIFAILYFPYVILKGKWHKDFATRLGFLSANLMGQLKAKSNIWVHAVSVGEVLAVSRLIQNIKKTFPLHHIVISTVTKTGYNLAKSTFPTDVIIFAPLDFSLITAKFVRVIDPKVYIATETEIWPNLFRSLFKRKVPIIQINGRISDRAFSRYKLVGSLVRKVLSYVTLFCMQSDSDSQKIKALGAPVEKVVTTGSIKFDEVTLAQRMSMKDLGLNDADSLLLAGSTHEGEEIILISIYKALIKEFPDLRLAIAPRHIERTADIIKLIKENDFAAVRFSEIKQDKVPAQAIVVIDTIGQLRSLYSLAKIVFVGKSLVVGGGQNIIEPANFAKPILIGLYMDNFKDITDIFLKEKAVIQVKNADELKTQITFLLKNPKEAERIGLAAKALAEKHRGATGRTMELIVKVMAASR